MFELVKALYRHGYQAIPNPLQARINDHFPGRPKLSENADMALLASICPAQAIDEHALDIGKCSFCGACQRRYPEMISFLPDFRLGASNRQDLLLRPGQEYQSRIEPVNPALLKRSLALRNVSAGGCNACELELGASSNVNFDMGRYGIEIVASPRHADGLILTGPITRNMADALFDTWEAIPQPKYLVLCGSCAISGGIFANSSQLDRSFLKHNPAHLFIPGCPAHPLSIIHALTGMMGVK